MTKKLDELTWVPAKVKTHIFSMKPDEVHSVNLKDPETRALIAAGHLEVLDEEAAALLPPPTPATMMTPAPGGCNCG